MEKKTKTIILVLVVAFLLYYFTRNKNTEQESLVGSETLEDKVSSTLKSASAKVNALVQENVAAATMTPEQEEYNLARQNYFNLYGAYPSSTWSLLQINTAIKDKKEVDKLISEYISKGGDRSKIDEDEDIVTLSEIKQHLALLNSKYNSAVATAERELKEWNVKIDQKKYDTIAKVNDFLADELLSREQNWNNVKKGLTSRASSMKEHITNQAKVSWYDEMADDSNWYAGLSLKEQVAVGDMMGWNPLLGGKLGWMRNDTRYLRKYRNAFAAANDAANNAYKYKVDKYGRLTSK